MERSETAGQYMARLQDFFDNWIEMAGVDKEYADLRNFIIVEQFLHNCPVEVSTHIREKEFKNMEDVIHTAEIFMDAHHIRPKQSQLHSQPKTKNSSQQSHVSTAINKAIKRMNVMLKRKRCHQQQPQT